jgi:hypothetical protein
MNAMRHLLITALLLTLSACGGGVFERQLPDGRMSHYISCNSYEKTYERCYAEANERCGSAGYDVIQRDRFTESESEAGSSAMSYGQGIWVACKELEK